MNKNLYTIFGYKDPEIFAKEVKERLENLYKTGTFSEEDYITFLEEKRRQGKSTTLCLEAIEALINNKKVVIRTAYKAQQVNIWEILNKCLPYLKDNPNLKVIRGTKNGNELIGLTYDLLLDDDKEMFRNA